MMSYKIQVQTWNFQEPWSTDQPFSCPWIWLEAELRCGLCMGDEVPLSFLVMMLLNVRVNTVLFTWKSATLCSQMSLCQSYFVIAENRMQSGMWQSKALQARLNMWRNTLDAVKVMTHAWGHFRSHNINRKWTVDTSVIVYQQLGCKVTFLYDIVSNWMQLFQESDL